MMKKEEHKPFLVLPTRDAFIANAFNESTLTYIAWKLTELLSICGMNYMEKMVWNGISSVQI